MELEFIKKLNETKPAGTDPATTTEQVKKFIPLKAGSYMCKLVDLYEKKTRNNNIILVSKFQVINGTEKNKVFTYSRPLPDLNNMNKKEQYKMDLLNKFIDGLGVTAETIEQAINCIYKINLTYENNYTNIEIVKFFNN